MAKAKQKKARNKKIVAKRCRKKPNSSRRKLAAPLRMIVRSAIYTVEMCTWLADKLNLSKRSRKSGKADRKAVVDEFNVVFKSSGVRLNKNKLAGLYLHQGGGNQSAFIAKFLPKKPDGKEPERAIVKEAQQVPPVAEKPPKAKRVRTSKPRSVETAPQPEPPCVPEPESTPLPVIEPEPVSVPEPVQETAPEPVREPEPSAPVQESAPLPAPRPELRLKAKLKPKKVPKVVQTEEDEARARLLRITPEESTAIASALKEWHKDLGGSAFGYAATRLNLARKVEGRPFIGADAVRKHVLNGYEDLQEGIIHFLNHDPVFALSFPDQAAQVAVRVAEYKPPARP